MIKKGQIQKRKLANYEQETIILFNESNDLANIFTYNRIWQKHLEEKLGLIPILVNGYGGKEYEINKKYIKPPKARRKLSAEMRAKAAERLRQIRNLRSRNACTIKEFEDEIKD